ncbi:MAG TPA: helix-turn-helix domain-containing protein, partial [Candidatus Ozemobacteraceae bacterium]|nr:helix-turn-helix domain-containing protein [Candidatus Ozemobacteraceae bacterium]
MSPKAIDRLFLVRQVIEDRYTVNEAARAMKLSERQVYRLLARFSKEGPTCLIHGNRGRSPSHSTSAEVKEHIVALAQGVFRGANFTHFSELLEEQFQIVRSPKTIGRILKKKGIVSTKSHSKPRRFRKRKRRPREGELVQMDASPFAWLEDRGPMMSLHGAIDDATGKVLGLYFRPTEDTLG